MAETAKDFRDAERRKMRLQAMLAAKRASLMTMGNPWMTPGESDRELKRQEKAWQQENNMTPEEVDRELKRQKEAWQQGELMTMGEPGLSEMFGGPKSYSSTEDKRRLWEQMQLEPKTLPDVDMSQPLSVAPGTVVPRPDDPPGRAAANRSLNQNIADVARIRAFAALDESGMPGGNLPLTGVLNAMNAKRIGATLDANYSRRPEKQFAQGQLDSLREDQALAQQAAQQSDRRETFVSSPYQRQPQTRTNPDARSVNPHGKADWVGGMDVNHWTGQATSGAGWGHGTALSDQWVPGQVGIDFIKNENLLRGYEYPSDKPTYGGAGRPGVVEPGVAPPLAQPVAQPVAQRAPQSSYGPGLTPAAAEELYGPGGMYSTQPLPGGLYDQQGISTGSSPFPWQRQTKSGSPQQIKSGSDHLVDEIKLIAKRKAIIAGSAALFGNVSDGRKAAERYEAKALASLGVYAGKYALSNLNDSDFQNKQKLFQALVEGGVMPLDQILKVVDSGVADEAKEKKFVNWTNGINTIPLREGQEGPPGYYVGKLEKGSKGNSMQFIDLEGVGHLGYVQHDENGIPRNFLMDGSSVPVGWDMVSPTANKTEITNNLGKQGQKMTEARQVAMAQMSRKWSNDAATYFFNEAGDFKADRLALILTSLNVPGEGRLAWTQMKSALASTLRLESGAAISVEEAAKFKSRFFPDATDTQKTIIWKLRAFSDYVRALEETNNPQWVYDNLPHTIWNPKKVKTEKERDALPPGSYFTTPNGSLHKLPHSSDTEVPLP